MKRSGAQFTFIIEGDGFLYKMCRGIVGTMVQAGLGKFPPTEIKTMLAKKDRRVGGHDGAGARAGAVEGVLPKAKTQSEHQLGTSRGISIA